MSLSAEQIKKDYETFRGLCGKCGEDRSEKILKMVDELEERIIECPASTKDEELAQHIESYKVNQITHHSVWIRRPPPLLIPFF